jgi:diadenosine tetraphosphate (Ap4A) HIT family hydrolase
MSLTGSTVPCRRDRIGSNARLQRTSSVGRGVLSRERSDCPFCEKQLDRSRALYDEKLFGDGLINVVPSLGPLCPGHLLAASRRHFRSMAELNETTLAGMMRILSELTAKLRPQFGNYFYFEHGTPLGTGGHGACIDHAHVHMLPMELEMFDQLMDALPWESISCIEDLARFRPVSYAYLGIKGGHYVCPRPDIGSQWIRREVCAILSRDDWDWALTDGQSDLNATLAGTRQALGSRHRNFLPLSSFLLA